VSAFNELAAQSLDVELYASDMGRIERCDLQNSQMLPSALQALRNRAVRQIRALPGPGVLIPEANDPGRDSASNAERRDVISNYSTSGNYRPLANGNAW